MAGRWGYEKITPGKTKRKRFDVHNRPKVRKYGLGITRCTRCGNRRGHINKYGLNVCRNCFREIAQKIGFKKNR